MTQLILAYNFPAKHLAKLRMAAMKLGLKVVKFFPAGVCKASARSLEPSEVLKAPTTEKTFRS